MRKPKFTEGQLVKIKDIDLPMGAVVIKLKLSSDMWLATVEQDNRVDDREFSSGDLRRLTDRECGDMKVGGRRPRRN